MTAKMDLAASRNIAWSPTIDLFFEGDPLPSGGAEISMQIRLYPGASGSAIASIPAISFEEIAPVAPETKRCLRLFPLIEQEALDAFPTGLNAPEPGEADAYAYDIIITYADGLQDKLAVGAFYLEPGVTRA